MTSKLTPEPELLGKKAVLHTRAFEVVEETIRLASGKETSRAIVIHPGAVVIVPLCQNGEVLLLRQFRQALHTHIFEFPAGTLEKGEQPLECAKREIVEETNHRADEFVGLGVQYPAPGFCNEIQYCYLARGLHPQAGETDEDEILEVISMKVKEVEQLIRVGDLRDAKSIAAFFKARIAGLL